MPEPSYDTLTVVSNFPRLMKFNNFNAPKSWSLLHLSTFFFYLFKNWVMHNFDHGFRVFSITASRRQNSSQCSEIAFFNNFPDRLYFPQVCIKTFPRSTLKKKLGIYQPYEYSWLFLSNLTKYIWQLIKNIAAIVIHMFGIHIQAELIQANLGCR